MRVLSYRGAHDFSDAFGMAMSPASSAHHSVARRAGMLRGMQTPAPPAGKGSCLRRGRTGSGH